MRIRAALLLSLLAVLGGCSALPGTGVDGGDVDPPPFPECRADSYAFAGRGTFAELGLVVSRRLSSPSRTAPR